MKPVVWICLTIWAVSTELILEDLIKYNARADLLEQAARALGKFQAPAHLERDSLHL
jgi:hypothetical protein